MRLNYALLFCVIAFIAYSNSLVVAVANVAAQIDNLEAKVNHPLVEAGSKKAEERWGASNIANKVKSLLRKSPKVVNGIENAALMKSVENPQVASAIKNVQQNPGAKKVLEGGPLASKLKDQLRTGRFSFTRKNVENLGSTVAKSGSIRDTSRPPRWLFFYIGIASIIIVGAPIAVLVGTKAGR